MQENTENIKNFSEKESNIQKPFWPLIFIFISTFFGLIGGAAGAYYFFNTPKGQEYIYNHFSKQVNQQVNISENSSIIDVVKIASPAVVSIVVSEDLNKIPGYGYSPFYDPFGFFYSQPRSNSPNIQQVSAGSGFFVSSDGVIITNKHVVSNQDASYTVLTSDGQTYEAKVLTLDPVQDIAIIKIDIKDAPFLNFADSEKLQIGQQVVAIGNSLGEYQNTVTAGIISGIGRKITAGGDGGFEDLSGVIQTDAAINPGNSGGPLLDMLGNVIGVNTAIDAQGQSVGFAIPANDVSKSLQSYQKNGRILRPFLGIRYIMLNKTIAEEQKIDYSYGALIVRGDTIRDFAVLPGSPADKAGLVENDIILELNNKKLDEKNTLVDALKKYNPGDVVELKVFSKGQEKNISLTLGENK